MVLLDHHVVVDDKLIKTLETVSFLPRLMFQKKDSFIMYSGCTGKYAYVDSEQQEIISLLEPAQLSQK